MELVYIRPGTFAMGGENALRFSRSNPPQYGVAIKGFTLTPAE